LIKKQVLVDTTIWVNYFRDNENAEILAQLFEDERVVINDVILTELLPAMNLYAKKVLIEKMRALECLPVFVNWEGLVGLQTQCLKHGVNGVGLPDLMIVQTALEYKLPIWSVDKHFKQTFSFLKFDLFDHK
jgi:predicted nucleic acid-binding protein